MIRPLTRWRFGDPALSQVLKSTQTNDGFGDSVFPSFTIRPTGAAPEDPQEFSL
jgi:hypothetical protein